MTEAMSVAVCHLGTKWCVTWVQRARIQPRSWLDSTSATASESPTSESLYLFVQCISFIFTKFDHVLDNIDKIQGELSVWFGLCTLKDRKTNTKSTALNHEVFGEWHLFLKFLMPRKARKMTVKRAKCEEKPDFPDFTLKAQFWKTLRPTQLPCNMNSDYSSIKNVLIHPKIKCRAVCTILLSMLSSVKTSGKPTIKSNLS